MTNAGVLAEDKLFATLDPTTRRVEMPGGKAVLFTDTVGFIQKLPTQVCGVWWVVGGWVGGWLDGWEVLPPPELQACCPLAGCVPLPSHSPLITTPLAATPPTPTRPAAGGCLPRHPGGDQRRLPAAARGGREPPQRGSPD